MAKTNYILESPEEFERLERQSQNEAYRYESELDGFSIKKHARILDAGCGSGVVSRFLAKSNVDSTVIGCDFSEERVGLAKAHSQGFSNLSFQKEDLTALTFQHSNFDAIICRYVLEHLDQPSLAKALGEFYRCLRPNGKIMAIDMDGFIYNIFPQTNVMEKVFSKLQSEKPLDMHVGRKIPFLLAQSGFENTAWKVETHSFHGKKLETELEFIQERFNQVMPFLRTFLGSQDLAKQFVRDYFECARKPGAVLFFNKFIVTGEKPGLRKL